MFTYGSLKNVVRIVPGHVLTSLKNETWSHGDGSLSCDKLVKNWNKSLKDSSFTMSTFSKSSLWLRSHKIPVESFLDLEKEPSFHSPSWMKWSLGDMYLELSHYAGGMQTYLKHSFSFQACVNMKLNLSRVLHGSSFCKNEPMPNLQLMIVVFIS